MKNYSYEEAISFFKNLPHFIPPKNTGAPLKEFFSLDAELKLLERLGNPQKDLQYIHVAGTNGKGSTAGYIATILKEAEVKSGCFTSPFLYSYNELFKVDGQDISDEDFARIFSIVRPQYDCLAEQGIFPSEYEILTSMAFCYFKEAGCDIAVLEVSLGGRMDTTNVIPAPLVTVITPISYDHMSILGNTLAEIATEKAGIIKEGTVVVSANQEPEVREVLENVCKDKQVELAYAKLPEPISRTLDGQKFRLPSVVGNGKVDSAANLAETYETSLLGTYQLDNAALAILAIEKLNERGFRIYDNAIRKGIKSAKWFGRFSIISKNPTIIVDGGHNRQGALALRKSLEAYFPNQKIVFVLGILKDKEVDLILEQLIPIAKHFYCVAVPNARTMSPEELVELIQEKGGRASVLNEGRSIESFVSKTDVVCHAGSLYSIEKTDKFCQKT